MREKSAWKTYLLWIVGVEAVGALAGFLTREASQLYSGTIAKPPLSPPGIVFPIVWSILYLLMGVGAARVYLAPESAERTKSLRIFSVQLAFNALWSILFFNFQSFGFALIWLVALWALILWMIRSFYRVDPPAARLQLPYLLWVTFAAYLNLGVWWLNR